jgi:hypothetical protein
MGHGSGRKLSFSAPRKGHSTRAKKVIDSLPAQIRTPSAVARDERMRVKDAREKEKKANTTPSFAPVEGSAFGLTVVLVVPPIAPFVPAKAPVLAVDVDIDAFNRHQYGQEMGLGPLEHPTHDNTVERTVSGVEDPNLPDEHAEWVETMLKGMMDPGDGLLDDEADPMVEEGGDTLEDVAVPMLEDGDDMLHKMQDHAPPPMSFAHSMVMEDGGVHEGWSLNSTTSGDTDRIVFDRATQSASPIPEEVVAVWHRSIPVSD